MAEQSSFDLFLKLDADMYSGQKGAYGESEKSLTNTKNWTT